LHTPHLPHVYAGLTVASGAAVFAYFRAPVPWRELFRRTVIDTIEDGCPGLAAQLAFYFFLAVFPALLFLISLLAYFPVEPAIVSTLQRLHAVLPREVVTLFERQVEQVLAAERSGLLTVGIAGAVWSSSSALTAIIFALNRAYDLEEFRPWWQTRLLAIGLTLALTVFVLLAFALVVGGADLAVWVASWIGAGNAFARVWRVAQWPIAFALVVVAVDLVYRFAPNADAEWVWITPGALLATGWWLLGSWGFRVYITNFGDYGAVYGGIGGVVVLLLWFYVSGFALLVGAELNAEIDRALPNRPGTRRRPGQPKAIGPRAERLNARRSGAPLQSTFSRTMSMPASLSFDTTPMPKSPDIVSQCRLAVVRPPSAVSHTGQDVSLDSRPRLAEKGDDEHDDRDDQ
jgi:membrane protein